MQTAERIRVDIQSGAYSPGEQLPSGQQMAKDYGVAVNTLRSALELLRQDGWVVTHHGRGSYVCEELPDVGTGAGDATVGNGEIRSQLAEIIRRLDAIENRLGGLGY